MAGLLEYLLSGDQAEAAQAPSQGVPPFLAPQSQQAMSPFLQGILPQANSPGMPPAAATLKQKIADSKGKTKNTVKAPPKGPAAKPQKPAEQPMQEQAQGAPDFTPAAQNFTSRQAPAPSSLSMPEFANQLKTMQDLRAQAMGNKTNIPQTSDDTKATQVVYGSSLNPDLDAILAAARVSGMPLPGRVDLQKNIEEMKGLEQPLIEKQQYLKDNPWAQWDLTTLRNSLAESSGMGRKPINLSPQYTALDINSAREALKQKIAAAQEKAGAIDQALYGSQFAKVVPSTTVVNDRKVEMKPPTSSGAREPTDNFQVNTNKNFMTAEALMKARKAALELQQIMSSGQVIKGSRQAEAETKYNQIVDSLRLASGYGANFTKNELARIMGQLPDVTSLGANVGTMLDSFTLSPQKVLSKRLSTIISDMDQNISTAQSLLKADQSQNKNATARQAQIDKVFADTQKGLEPNKGTPMKEDPTIRKYADEYFKGDYVSALKWAKEKRGYGK